MTAAAKAYRGIGMEGPIAAWYTKNTGRDRTRFTQVATLMADRTRPGSRILEVAPGPGYLSVELAKRGYNVTALDISESFVRIARAQAEAARVRVDVRHGNASSMPFADASFDAIVCVAAFKNFTNPAGAIDEMYRVLCSGGSASVIDLRKDAGGPEISAAVDDMHLNAWNAMLTRWTFRHVLLKRAYTRERLESMAAGSRFERWAITPDGIGFELRLLKA